MTGEYTLKLPERPQPRELCLKIGAACVAIVAAYQVVFVLPDWHALVTQPIADAGGNTTVRCVRPHLSVSPFRTLTLEIVPCRASWWR